MAVDQERVNKIFSAITEKLEKENNVPESMFLLGAWLSMNFSDEDMDLIVAWGEQVGEREANKRMVEVLVASKKYIPDGEDNVRPA